LKRLDIKNESRPIVNVYNKKVVEEQSSQSALLALSGGNGFNGSRGSGFVIENLTQNITSFMESINVGVSIVELSPDDIN
jgi:hypothetical protein